jgi:hypothetical protein
MIKKFKVCSLDVWGNGEDGFEVNDMHQIGTIDVDSDWTDRQLYDALVELGHLDAEVFHLASFEWSSDSFIGINEASNGKPVLQLIEEF